MSLEFLPDTLRLREVGGVVSCEGRDCHEYAEVHVCPEEEIGGDELMAHLWHEAGFDEDGRCPCCARTAAQEESEERRRYEESIL